MSVLFRSECAGVLGDAPVVAHVDLAGGNLKYQALRLDARLTRRNRGTGEVHLRPAGAGRGGCKLAGQVGGIGVDNRERPKGDGEREHVRKYTFPVGFMQALPELVTYG